MDYFPQNTVWTHGLVEAGVSLLSRRCPQGNGPGAYCKQWSVGLVGGEQCSIHRLHAGGAGEGAHEPVVYAVLVVGVHTGQVAQWVSQDELSHTYHTSETHNICLKRAFGLMYEKLM